MKHFILFYSVFFGIFLVIPFFSHPKICQEASATEIQLRDGRHYSGREGMLIGIGGDIPAPGSFDPQTVQMNIVFLDDDLRRTYFARKQVVKVDGAAGAVDMLPEKFDIPQKIKESGVGVSGVGAITRRTPFNEHGRRTITMMTTKGATDLVQCITELTPRWARVQCANYVWDMRLATTSIPKEELVPILRKQALRINKGNEADAALMIARFFVQGERYEEAAWELNRVLQAAKLDTQDTARIAPMMRVVRQRSAQQLLEELELRRKNGQHLLARSLLEKFPSDAVAGQTLAQVREILDAYENDESRIEKIIYTLQEEWEKLEPGANRDALKPVIQEITDELNFNTLSRMEAFENRLDVDGTTPAEKVALGVTSWLMGSQNASSRLIMAVSSLEVRGLMEAYMRAGSEIGRESVLRKFQYQEAANVTCMAAILAYMKPAVSVTKEQWMNYDGFFKITTESTASEKSVTYHVQLPLEYDPHRLYPVVLALTGLGDSPVEELKWWAGGFSPTRYRVGQAGRHGFIVVTPQWSFSGQREYDFTQREHRAVLETLRDVSQRFSVDSDRVFLAGRFAGGDAAWDIALSHPDLWAGVVLFSCHAKKYCQQYWQNAEMVPIYYVCGELDGDILPANSGSLTRYLNKGYDTTIVEYLGRGREDFSDEVQRIFDWMNRKRRNFYPETLTVRSMRATDNFFWWIQVDNFPPKSVVNPAEWPKRGATPIKIEASWNPSANVLKVNVPTGFVRIWVGPKMLDFERKINILVNGKNIISPQMDFAPDIKILLKDYYARGDRQNPFYQMMEYNTGRVKK